MNEENYERISEWFRKDKRRLEVFVFIYRILPCFVIIAYGFVIIYEIFYGSMEDRIRITAVPAITFLLCTVFRKVINEQRPYEALKINPLIKKEKKGQSFPSRHMVSVGVIAMTAMYVNRIFGVVVLGIGVLIGIIRPMAGVHYIRDVAAGFAFGILCGVLGLFII